MRKRGIRHIFLAYASGYQVFKQHQFILAAIAKKADFLQTAAVGSGLEENGWYRVRESLVGLGAGATGSLRLLKFHAIRHRATGVDLGPSN